MSVRWIFTILTFHISPREKSYIPFLCGEKIRTLALSPISPGRIGSSSQNTCLKQSFPCRSLTTRKTTISPFSRNPFALLLFSEVMTYLRLCLLSFQRLPQKPHRAIYDKLGKSSYGSRSRKWHWREACNYYKIYIELNMVV